LEIFLLTLLTILAGGIGTLTGFGTSTIMVPVLLIFWPLPQTLLLVGIIHWFGDIWKIILFRSGLQWKIILSFGLTGVIASYLGASIIFTISESLMTRILGVFMLIYVVVLTLKPGIKVKANLINTGVGGILSGFLAGVFGIGGAVRGMFLTAYDLPKAVYISTAGMIALIIDTSRISTYLLNNTVLSEELLLGLLLFIPASFLGAKIAKKIADKIPQKYFRSFISIFLLLAATNLIFLQH